MKTVTGDLIKLALRGEFDAIVHGCNCHGVMGAGVARAVAKFFPEAYKADLATPRGSKVKLGTCSIAVCPIEDGAVWVINAYTQYSLGGGTRNTDYEAVRSCMRVVKDKFAGQRIGLPLIGCGLGGGSWEMVSAIIDEELEGEDVTLVLLG